MPLPLALVFHFNQHTNQHAEVANRTCYRGLLNVLRAHPKLKFNLHLSGTLLRALNWFDSDTLALVRSGREVGQFELLASTYAQNNPYACDDWDNAQQIGLHQQVLKDLFGVEPVTFWNAERCWRQSLVKVMAESGLRVTLVEDHILRAAGHTDPLPASTTFDGHTVTLVYDDTLFRERLNFAAWFGRRAQLFNYLDAIAERPNSKKFVLAYAEDAEAMGLWPWEAGYLPHAAWANLDKLLSEIEEREAYKLVHLGSVQAQTQIESLPDGAARWMDQALLDANRPYHEDGYRNWFEFLHNSPKNQYFRKLHTVVRSNLQQVGAALETGGYHSPVQSPADRFYRQAIETYCSHQYEFGCIGVGGRGYWGWENVRSAFLFTRLAEIAANPEPRRWIEDLNGDGSDEQLLCDGRQLAMFTAYGGRLLGWYDLHAGRQWVGNQLAVPPAPYTSGASQLPTLTAMKARWLPDTFEADLKAWKEQKIKEAAPTKLGRHLSPELFAREADELTMYVNPPAPNGAVWPLTAQIGALNDWLTLDRGDEQQPDGYLDYRFEDEGVIRYLNTLTPALKIEKRVSLSEGGLRVHYTLNNQTDRKHHLRWRLTNELNPDYAEMLTGGRAALEVVQHEGRYPAIRNTRTGATVIVKPSVAWVEVGYTINLLSFDLWLAFEWELPAREEVQFTVELLTDP
ncbi:MAG: hypothetical protein ACT4QE_08750 [Anaerolineales bacterium]